MTTKRQLERYNASQKQAIVRLREERDKEREQTRVAQGRIKDLALAHTPELYLVYEADSLPVVREGEPTQLGSMFTRNGLELKCGAKNCAFMWPCPSYLWATETEPFTVAVIPKST